MPRGEEPRYGQEEDRIHQRAYEIWLKEGQPDGRDKEHWKLAMLAIAQEDALAGTLVPPAALQQEPIEAVINQGEVPTRVDQGEGQAPGENQ